jgi:hypothetical protein
MTRRGGIKVGYKSVMRSFGAAMRQAERESIRRQKELQRRRVAYEKMQALEQAAYDVEVHENYIERITSLHKDCISDYDWQTVSRKTAPVQPEKTMAKESSARSKLEGYKPNFIDRLFKLETKKRAKLAERLSKAMDEDRAENGKSKKEYQDDLNEHNELVALANGILQGESAAYRKAIEEFEPLSEISEIGTDLRFDFKSKHRIAVFMSVHDKEIVPKESKSLLKSGKLSTKEMPIGRFNAIYQDYVCSASLRVAREIFGLLPIEEIIVTTKSKLLNKATGRLEEQAILSVRFVRETVHSLNFENIDPSDSMTNFVYNMGFKKNQGLVPVEELSFA